MVLRDLLGGDLGLGVEFASALGRNVELLARVEKLPAELGTVCRIVAVKKGVFAVGYHKLCDIHGVEVESWCGSG